MLQVTSSDEFTVILLLVLNVIFYLAVISVPIELYAIWRKCDQRLDSIEKELHKLNDFSKRP